MPFRSSLLCCLSNSFINDYMEVSKSLTYIVCFPGEYIMGSVGYFC